MIMRILLCSVLLLFPSGPLVARDVCERITVVAELGKLSQLSNDQIIEALCLGSMEMAHAIGRRNLASESVCGKILYWVGLEYNQRFPSRPMVNACDGFASKGLLDIEKLPNASEGKKVEEPSLHNGNLELTRSIYNSLSCNANPDPAFLMRQFLDMGKIRLDEREVFDSVTCFRIIDGIALNGVVFNKICGFEESESIRLRFPEFFLRQPGTSPGLFIELQTQADYQQVVNWYERTIRNALIPGAVSQYGETSAVKCSSWMR
jgi:hypothetical protein